ncbi:MAG: DUF3253 domain-containing protein [Planctomycetota bacterium]
MASEHPEKTCARCGRRIEWRKKWANCWDEVRYCGERCRRHKPGAAEAALEQVIRDLLAARAQGATICPSEAARRFAADQDGEWREWMEPTRQAARRLVAAGELEITQKGRVVDPSTAKGAIRLRRKS